MKSRLLSYLLAAAVVSTLLITHVCMVNAQGGETDPSRAYKIGVVDMQRVMDDYNKRKIEVGKLEKEAEELRAAFKDREEKISKAIEDFKDSSEPLNDELRTEREDELRNNMHKLESDARQADNDLKRKQRRLKDSLLKDIMRAVDEVAAAGNYHLIFEADPETRTGVLFYSTPLNMTQKVVDKLNS